MYNIEQDYTDLGKKLESMDFYSVLADRESMLKNFINRLDQREQRSKSVERRRSMRPAAIAAMITVITLLTGFTVFADGINGLLKQLNFTGGTANKVEQLELGEEYPPDADTKILLEGFEYAEESEGKSESFMEKHKFASLEEAKDILRFTMPEPKGLNNWELVSVKAFSNGKEIYPYAVELIYDKLENGDWQEITGAVPQSDASSSVFVYMHYLGENANVKIDTTKDIHIVPLNGIEAVLTGPLPYERGKAYGLTWVQDGIAIKIFPSACTYDDFISFAEAFVSAGSE